MVKALGGRMWSQEFPQGSVFGPILFHVYGTSMIWTVQQEWRTFYGNLRTTQKLVNDWVGTTVKLQAALDGLCAWDDMCWPW